MRKRDLSFFLRLSCQFNRVRAEGWARSALPMGEDRALPNRRFGIKQKQTMGHALHLVLPWPFFLLGFQAKFDKYELPCLSVLRMNI